MGLNRSCLSLVTIEWINFQFYSIYFYVLLFLDVTLLTMTSNGSSRFQSSFSLLYGEKLRLNLDPVHYEMPKCLLYIIINITAVTVQRVLFCFADISKIAMAFTFA